MKPVAQLYKQVTALHYALMYLESVEQHNARAARVGARQILAELRKLKMGRV